MDNLIEFAKEQCEVFPKDSEMGRYLRETMKMLQAESCEDAPDTNVGSKKQAEPCEDAVSRQAVSDFLGNHAKDFEDAKTRMAFKAASSLVKNTDNVPPVTLTRKKGKWIIDNVEVKAGRIWHCHCSECKKDPQGYIGGSENWWVVRLPKYCPYCGCLMEGEE